jgi:sugar lactone lactonase YvrE
MVRPISRPVFLSLALALAACILAFPRMLHASSGPVSLLEQINTVAGTHAPGFSGDGGAATLADVNLPQGVALDGAGNLYIADTANNRIRRVDVFTGIITTVAGTGAQGYAGDGGAATQAEFNQPQGIAADAQGNLYIGDTGNNVVRKINAATGVIATLAGTGAQGYAGDGGLATAAKLNLPTALAVDAAGDVYIADTGNNRIRRVNAANGLITLYAGNGATVYNGDGVQATQTALSAPRGLVLDAQNNLYLSDTGHNLVREVSASTGILQILSGNPLQPGGYSGDNGPALNAELNGPTGLALDANGNLYIADTLNARIRQIVGSTITTLAGNGTAGFAGDGALASQAELNNATGLAVDAEGRVDAADTTNNAVRQISTGRSFPAEPLALATPVTRYLYVQFNSATTLNSLSVSAGADQQQEFSLTTVSTPPVYPIGTLSGCTNGMHYAANAVCVVALHFAPADPGESRAALSIATSAGPVDFGLHGPALGPEVVLTPGTITSILPLLTTMPNQPTYEQTAIDPQGDVFVADKTGNQISLWCAAANASLGCTGANASVVYISSSSGATITATLNAPTAVSFDAAGNLYITNSGTNQILRVDAATHAITTAVGNGTQGYSGDGGAAASAELNAPGGVTADAAGNLYIADSGNNVVRRVDALTGLITTLAGTGVQGFAGDGDAATLAQLNDPFAVALDADENLYIADTGNSAIRKVHPITGLISTVAGIGGTAGYAGDGGNATQAQLASPLAIAVDAAGNLYIADTGNARLRRVDAASGVIETIAGSGRAGFSGDGGSATQATLEEPSGVSMDALGRIVIADQTAGAVRAIAPQPPAPLSFGNSSVGCGVTEAQTVELANTGNLPLNLSALAAPVDFPLVNNGGATCVANGAQAAGSVCAMSFVFAPTAPGSMQESASVTDNTLNIAGSVQGIQMSGVGEPLNVLATTTTVFIAPVTLAYGAPLTLTATVTSAQGPVTSGYVMFSVNGVEVGSAPLNGAGVATLTIPAAPTGSGLTVLASHPQQCNFGPSDAQTSLTVVQAATATTLTASTNQAQYGQPVTLEAVVVPVTSGVPTGVVNFMDGSAQIAQATLDGTGHASVVLNQQALPLGVNSFTALYLGDTNFLQSTSNAVTINVYDGSLKMTINPSQVQLASGASAQVQVTLTPANGFNQTITLSCAGLVAGATCTFAPATIPFNTQTSTQQVTLTIQSNLLATSGLARTPGIWTSGAWGLWMWMLLALTLLAASLLHRARQRGERMRGILPLLLLCAAALWLPALSGCNGAAPLPPVSTTVQVQASTPTQGMLVEAPLQLNLAQ